MVWPIPRDVGNDMLYYDALDIINKGVLGPVFNAKGFNVKGDGITNDTANLVTAYTAAQAAKGVLYLPEGHYRYDNKVIDMTNRAGVIGAGKRLTFLQPFSTYSGYAITITNCWRNGTESAVLGSQTLDIATSKAGCFLRGFTIFADRNAGPAHGISTQGINDFLFIDDVDLCFLDGTALSLGPIDGPGQIGTVRESRFRGMVLSHCGNLAEPALNICGSATVGSSDGVNDLYFSDINLSNNRGVHARIAAAKAASSTRGILFSNLVVNGDGPEAPSPTPSDLIVIEGLVACELRNYLISGCATVAGTPYAAVRMKSNASGQPDRIVLDGDISNVAGEGYVIDAASLVEIHGTSGAVNPNVELRVNSVSQLQYDVKSGQTIANRTNNMIVFADETTAQKVYGDFRRGSILTATDGDATPDVKVAEVLFLNNTSPVDITDFDFGGRGHILTVVCAFGSVEPTLKHGSPALLLRGARDRKLHQNQGISFIHSGATQWIEMSVDGGTVVDGFNQDNVAANQVNVELVRALGRCRAVRPGAVMGLLVTSTLARTAGTLTIKLFKNTGLAGAAGAQLGAGTVVLDGTNTSRMSLTQLASGNGFLAGDELYLTVTTDAAWAPTTAGIRCALEVVT
jgi:hypothetical protein